MFTMDEDLSQNIPLKIFFGCASFGPYYPYLGQSSTKCSQLFLESSEIVCETGQAVYCTCARCQIVVDVVAHVVHRCGGSQ